MTLIPHYQFVPTKAEEESGEASGNFPLQPFRYELVEKRDEPPYLLDLYNLWEIKKVLTVIDVGTLGGLVLGPEQVDNIFNNHTKYWTDELKWKITERRDHIKINIRDLDKNSEHSLWFKKSTIDDCYVISTFWNRDFVYRRGLREGDTIGMYWHDNSSSFCFSVLKRAGGAE